MEEFKKNTKIPLPGAVTPSSPPPFYGSVDGGFEKERIVKAPGEGNTRDFTYFMLGNNRIIYASAVRLALIKVCFILLSRKLNFSLILKLFSSELYCHCNC